MNLKTNATIGLLLTMLMASAILSSLSGLPTAEAAHPSGINGSCVTGIQVQNLDKLSPANITIDLYGQGTEQPPTEKYATGIPALSAWTAYLGGAPELSAGLFSARASADRTIGSIARTDWLSSGGAAIYSNVRTSNRVVVPLIAIDYVGQFSQVSIQNTDETAEANVAVELLATGSDTPALTEHFTILPRRSITIDTTSWVGRVTPNTPYGFVGAMNITSDVAVGAQSLIDITTSDKAVYAFEGIPAEDAAKTLYAPLIRKRHFNYDTGISVSNPNSTAVDVEVLYIGTGGACAGMTTTHGPVSIAANSSHVFYQGPGVENHLPDGCLGSAVITSEDGPVMAVVIDSLNFTEAAAAYNAMPASMGSDLIALPLVRNRFLPGYELTTGIQVMNVGTEPTSATITYIDETGVPISGCTSCTSTIAPGASINWFPGTTRDGLGGGPPAGSYGSAMIESDGQPLIAIVNDFSYTGAMDVATYNGIPVMEDAPTENFLPFACNHGAE